MPHSIKDAGIDKESFDKEVRNMANIAFLDQCTGANPRYPLVDEIVELYDKAYNGEDIE